MKHTRCAVASLTLLLTACATGTQAANQAGMNRLKTGMSKEDVQKEMGPPEKTESLVHDDGTALLVWWYSTSLFASDPVVFEDDVVVGWGKSARAKLPRKK